MASPKPKTQPNPQEPPTYIYEKQDDQGNVVMDENGQPVMEEYFNKSAAARYTGFSLPGFSDRMKRLQIPSGKVPGGIERLFLREDLDRMMNRRPAMQKPQPVKPEEK